jgi:NACHT domain
MRPIRWCLAIVGYLVAFGLSWWVLEQLHLRISGSDRLTIAIGIGGVVSAAAGGPLFSWAGRDRSAAWPWGSASSRAAGSSLDDIQRKMRSIWIEQVLRESLEMVAAVELGFGERADAVVVPMRQRRPDKPPKEFPKGTPVLTIFNLDDVERRLLLLGQPGAGKTTQLLHLAESMLDRAAADPAAPVPVYLSLSAGEWEEMTLKRREKPSPAIKWFAEQIASNYLVSKRKVLSWLDSDPCPVVLLLDGLDEIPSKEQRAKCIRALSQARTVTSAGMVVACRTNDYYSIGQLIRFGSAIEILPLTVTDINEYLHNTDADLEALRQAVFGDAMLAMLLDTPLMLCVAAIAYKGREIGRDLLVGSLHKRRDHLWRSYVAAMTARRRNPQEEYTGDPRFPPAKTRDCLKFLARAMDDREVLDFHPGYFRNDWLPEDWRSVLLSLSVLRALSLLGLLAFSAWSFYTSGGGLLAGVLGVILGFASAVICLSVLISTQLDNAAAWKWDWGYATRVLVFSACWGLFVMIFLILGGRAAIAYGGLWGLGIGLSIASVAGWRPQDDRTKIPRRLSVWRVFCARILTFGLCVAFGFCLLPAARHHHINFRSPMVSVAMSSCAGFAAAALIFSIELLVDHYSSRLVAAYAGFFPFRATKFLDHSDERILLRRVGYQYRFLHLTLRDYMSGKPRAIIESATLADTQPFEFPQQLPEAAAVADDSSVTSSADRPEAEPGVMTESAKSSLGPAATPSAKVLWTPAAPQTRMILKASAPAQDPPTIPDLVRETEPGDAPDA